jgi:hypothetical protein
VTRAQVPVFVVTPQESLIKLDVKGLMAIKGKSEKGDGATPQFTPTDSSTSDQPEAARF